MTIKLSKEAIEQIEKHLSEKARVEIIPMKDGGAAVFRVARKQIAKLNTEPGRE